MGRYLPFVPTFALGQCKISDALYKQLVKDRSGSEAEIQRTQDIRANEEEVEFSDTELFYLA